MKSLENTLLETQIEVSNLMNDLTSRIDKVYDKYTVAGNIPDLPPFKELKKDEVRYECTRVLTKCVDELNEMKLRVSILYRGLHEYKNYQPSSKTDYIVTTKFKESIKDYLEILVQYRFDLDGLVKNANSKLRALEMANYYDFQ